MEPVDVRLYTNVASLLPCLLGQWALEGGLSEAAAAELAFRGAWMSLATSLLAFVYGSADFLVLEVVLRGGSTHDFPGHWSGAMAVLWLSFW
eukprot:g19296.t1